VIPVYPQSRTLLLDSKVVAATWALLLLLPVAYYWLKWSGRESAAAFLAFLALFLLAAATHVVLSLCHKCPACGKHPTIQGFKPPHPRSSDQSAMSGWAGAVVNVLLRRRLVCIHCGTEFRVEA
jgi:hypothetical protein